MTDTVDPRLQTRATELFDVRFPIVQTGMGWVAGASLVSGTANAGGLGILAAASMTFDEMVEAIDEVHERTDQPFGVNLRTDAVDIEQRVDHLISAEVKVASFAQAPRPDMVAKLKEAGAALESKAAELSAAQNEVESKTAEVAEAVKKAQDHAQAEAAATEAHGETKEVLRATQVHAVIRGCASSSDGKAPGIYAPTIEGQEKAIRRAYELSGVDPATVTMVEGHGTGTPVGDAIELTALKNVLGEGAARESNPQRERVAVGSIKSQIGHLKSAAGAASLIKTSLALHHKILPPSINFKTPRQDVPFDTVPLQVQSRAESWETEGWDRMAGVSAFGFGGTNFHVVLKEYLPGVHAAPKAVAVSAAPAVPVAPAAPPPPLPTGSTRLRPPPRRRLASPRASRGASRIPSSPPR